MRALSLCILTMWTCAAFGQADDVWHGVLSTEETHPSLLCGADEVPLMQERFQREPYSQWWASVRGRSDLVSLAFTWCMTGDEEKGKAAREQLLRAYPSGYHCSCGVADALQAVAEAYDLLYHYKGLTPRDHRVIRAKIAAACERMYLSALETGNGQHPGNQRTRGICALGTAAIVLRGYKDAAHTPRDWLQRALDGIRQEANLEFWRPDGMFIEGPGYSAFTLGVMLPFARYYERACGRWMFSEPRLRNALLYLVHQTQPDGVTTSMGTTNMCNVVAGLKLAVGAGSPEDQALVQWAVLRWGSLADGDLRELCLYDADVHPSTEATGTTQFFPTSQEAAMRSDWGSHAVAFWFKGKDPWLAGGHTVYSHGDVGSFVLHAYGELLAVDAGYDHWVSYNLYPPELHNTLLVDGQGPVNATPGVLENPVDATALRAGDITSQYGGVDLRRTLLLADGRYVVIADDVKADAEHEYQWQVHTPVSREGGSVAIEGNRATWTGFDPRSGNPGRVSVQATWAGPVGLATMDKSRWQPYDPDPVNGSYDNWAIVAKRKSGSVRYLAALCPYPTGSEVPAVETPQATGGLALTVTEGPVTDTFLAAEGPEVSLGALKSTARTVAVRLRDGQVERVYQNGPGRVEHGGRRLCEIAGTQTGAVALQMAALTEGPVRRRGFVCGPAGMVTSVSAEVADGPVFFRGPDGAWQELVRERKGEGVSVTLPVDLTQGAPVVVMAEGQTPSVDRTAPRPAELMIAGEARPAGELVSLGRLEGPLGKVSIRYADDESGLWPQAVRATVDGLPLGGLTVDDNGELSLDLSAVTSLRDHELVLAVPDRAPVPNVARFLLTWSLAPLLRNGGFEARRAATRPMHGHWEPGRGTRTRSTNCGPSPTLHTAGAVACGCAASRGI